MIMGNVIDQVISHESLIRRQWLTVDQAAEEIVAFEDRFGKEHFELACHAALPLILTPELINLIRVNYFDREEFPWIAEQDFLLSSLCRPVGDGLFEVEPRVREILLAQLEEDFGRYRLRDLAEFLLAYTESPLGGHQRVEINQLIRWIALAYVAPATLVQELTEDLHASVSPERVGPSTLSRHIKIATAYELVADALERSLPREEYQGLASDSRLMAYYWYGDRAGLTQHLTEEDEDGPKTGPDAAAKPPTVFLDWVKQSPAHLPRTHSDEIPLAPARSEWGRIEEERFERSRPELDRIPDLLKSYRVVAIIGAPGPARTEFVRLLAERLRPSFVKQIYVNLTNDQFSIVGADLLRAEVTRKMKPGLPPVARRGVDSDTYKSLLSEQASLIVADNLAMLNWGIESLAPPPESFLLAIAGGLAQVPAEFSDVSAYVIRFDGVMGSAEEPGFLLAEKMFLQTCLIDEMRRETNSNRARLLSFLPEENRSEVSIDEPPYVFASRLLESLLTKEQQLSEFLNMLLERSHFDWVRARLIELKEKIGRAGSVETFAKKELRPSWPKAPATFVDRVWELEAIKRALLGKDERKLVVIEGSAGIGKTALVMKTLEDAEIQQAFPGGVIWPVPIIHQNPRDVVESIADSLDLFAESSNLESYPRSVMRLRQLLSERRAIVVLEETTSPDDQAELVFSLGLPALIYTTRPTLPNFSSSSFATIYHKYILEPLPIDAAVELVKKLAPDATDFFPALERLLTGSASENRSPRQLQELASILREYKGDDAQSHLQSLLGTHENSIRDGLFISYSHQDREWLEMLQTSLKPFTGSHQVSIWDDTKIKPGSQWKDEFEKALASVKVVLLLVSANYLASDFIIDYELPLLLEAAEKEGLLILWVALGQSEYRRSGLAQYQAVNDPSRPLSGLNGTNLEMALAGICQRVAEALSTGGREREKHLADLDNRAGTNLVTVDVIKLLSDLITQRKRLIGPQIIWRLDHSDALVYVRGNPDVLRELFSQVIDNAVQAVKGISKPRVNISSLLKDDKISISIADNGRGIAPEARQLIFQPFTSLREQSPGLGLFIAAHIAQLYGGSINLESVDRAGATFVVSLPVERMAGNQAVILVVDDDMALLEWLRKFLESQGHDVITATDADTARVLIKRKPVDLAILDIRLGLGQSSGLELAREEPFRKLPVIFFSGMLDPKTVRKALEPQPDGLPLAVDVVEKGSSSDRLLQAIEKALEQRNLSRNTEAETEFYSCFISFSSGDEDFARKLHTRLEQEGVRVWFAPEDMQSGQRINDQIEEAIQSYDKVVLILSANSMHSEWVATEIRKARAEEVRLNRRKLYPIRVVDLEVVRDWEVFDVESGRDLATQLREYFIPDFSNWKDANSFEAAFRLLLRDLRASQPPIAERTKIDTGPEYRVFLCYNYSDRAAVEEIANQLRQKGIRPWFAHQSLRPGRARRKLLSEELEGIKSAAVFIGSSSGPRPWSEIEINEFLRELIKKRLPVIPVILPRVRKIPKLPTFMENLTWLDLRQNRPDAIDRLIEGITRGESTAPARQMEES